MSIFRSIWHSEPRGIGKAADSGIPSPDYDQSESFAASTPSGSSSPTRADSTSSDRSVKRRRSSSSICAPYHGCESSSPAKRLKSDNYALLSPQSTFGDSEGMASSDSAAKPNLDDAKETIQFQFGLEILLKHEELRLIDQELAKCQIALEQLRRCHLIPYPVSCPTPDQMLQISSGKGAALQTRPGEAVPRWAPPFGVVDGPYSRHYAKWLIPDPAFGDVVPQPQRLAEGTRSKNATAEGRATRNSITDYSMLSKARPGRASAGQKLQALSSGYTQPKDKAGPCLVKKSDGETVKLVCVDCKRWDFSSTQGFINHCRIAHKKEYKSHEEAAIHAGRPIELDEAGSIVGNEMPPAPAAPAPSGLVHPFARSEFITDQQGYARLFSRLNESVKLYKEGKLPHVNSIPVSGRAKEGAPQAPPAFSGAPTTPYLSQLLQKTNFSGDLGEHVEDAKTKTVTEDVYAAGDDSEDSDHPMGMDGASSPIKAVGATAARASGVMRMPARTLVSAVPLPTLPRPGSSKSNVSPGGLSAPRLSSLPEKDEALNLYDAVDMHLSPSTVTGHNAPSLVSDDGEYDDSDDGSSSDTSDGLDTESVSDVAEINIDEDTDETPRPVLHHRTNSATTVKLRKDEAKHVTFVTPIPGNGKAITANTKQRRKQNV